VDGHTKCKPPMKSTPQSTCVKCIPMHFSAFQCISVHSNAFHCISVHSNASQCIPMHFSALRSLTQPLLDCRLYLTLTQYPYDSGTLPSSANQCILGNVYLRFNLSRNPPVSVCSCRLMVFPSITKTQKAFSQLASIHLQYNKVMK